MQATQMKWPRTFGFGAGCAPHQDWGESKRGTTYLPTQADLAVPSKRDLSSHRDGIELGPDIAGVGRALLLVDLAMHVVEHESDVAVDVPVEACRDDSLLAAGSPICKTEPIIKIDVAVTGGNFPRTPTAFRPGEWIRWHNTQVGRVGGVVGTCLARNHPTGFRVAALIVQRR